MVYAMSYRPKASSYPRAEWLNGDRTKVDVEDKTPDGGTGLNISQMFSGRRLGTEHLPTRIEWQCRRPLLDFEATGLYNVSPRFRDLIEQIEPGTHQFVPVAFVARDGSPLATRWFWQVCNRLDSVHRERTTFVLDRGSWGPPEQGESRLIFDRQKIGNAKFWHDKHDIRGPMITDDVKDRLEAAGMTGIHFKYYEDA